MGEASAASASLRVWAVDVSEYASLRAATSGAEGEPIKRVAKALLPNEEAVAVGKYIRAIDQARKCQQGEDA